MKWIFVFFENQDTEIYWNPFISYSYSSSSSKTNSRHPRFFCYGQFNVIILRIPSHAANSGSVTWCFSRSAWSNVLLNGIEATDDVDILLKRLTLYDFVYASLLHCCTLQCIGLFCRPRFGPKPCVTALKRWGSEASMQLQNKRHKHPHPHLLRTNSC